MRAIRVAVLLALLLLSGDMLLGQERPQRFEVAEQYTYFHQQHGQVIDNSLLGGRFDFRVSRRVWLTAQLDGGLMNHPPPRVGSMEGGRMLLGCFGVKVGREGRRLGVFGDLRGGFLTWSQAMKFLDVANMTARFGRWTEPLLNIGATFEIYARPSVGFRVSVGDSIVFYPERTLVSVEPPFPAFTSHNTQVSSGVFYRF